MILEFNKQEPTDLIGAENIEKIESSPFNIEDKINILLVVAGVKPASKITVENNPILIQQIKEIIDSLGLPFDYKQALFSDKVEDFAAEKKGSMMDIFVAKDQKSLEDLEEAWKQQSDFSIGLASGYPASAVENYFHGGPGYMRWELPEDVKVEDYYPFIRFKLSQGNWENEIKTAIQWADAIRSNSPKLLEEFKSHTRLSDQQLVDAARQKFMGD